MCFIWCVKGLLISAHAKNVLECDAGNNVEGIFFNFKKQLVELKLVHIQFPASNVASTKKKRVRPVDMKHQN